MQWYNIFIFTIIFEKINKHKGMSTNLINGQHFQHLLVL